MKKLQHTRAAALLTAAALCLLTACAQAPAASPAASDSAASAPAVSSAPAAQPSESPATDGPDYANADNWAYYESGTDKAADVFLICPTVDMGSNGNTNMAMDDEQTKANFVGALNMERGIYDGEGAMFSPYYRQASFPVYSMSDEDAAPCFELAYQDVKSAFLYYMEHENNGRPIVLAGFSQGSDMTLRLLKDVFREESLQEQLVAAYCIGWRVTQDDLDACPWLKMAEGEKDTGCIIAFNSEDEAVTDSMLIPAGVKTFAINPLNWATDSTPADKSLNLGACFTNYKGEITYEVPQLTGAYIDETRGALKLPDIDPADYANSLFPDGVYHLYDYQFFYRNLQQNVSDRIAARQAAQQNAAA